MGKFQDWLKANKKLDESWFGLFSDQPKQPEVDKKARKEKLAQMRHWLFQKQKGANTPQPVAATDPDMAWIQKKMEKLGPLDPNAIERPDPMNLYGAGRGVTPF